MAAIIIRLALKYVPEVAKAIWGGFQAIRNLPLPAGVAPVLMMTAQLLIFPAIGSVAMYMRRKAFDLKVLPTPVLQRGTLNRVLGHVSYLWPSDWHSVLSSWTASFKGLFKLRLMLTTVVVVTDPNLVAEVLGPDTRGVPQRTAHHQYYDQCMGATVANPSMFSTHDEAHWNVVRQATAPAFTSANIRTYCTSLFTACDAMLADIETQRTSSTPASSSAPKPGFFRQRSAKAAKSASSQAATSSTLPPDSIDVLPHLTRMTFRATLEGLLDVDVAQLGLHNTASISDATSAVVGTAAGIATGAGSAGVSSKKQAASGVEEISSAELPARVVQMLDTAGAMAKNPLRAWLMQNVFAQAFIPASGRWADTKMDVRDFFTKIAQQIQERKAAPASNTQLWACLQRMTDARGMPATLDTLTSEVGMYVCMGMEKGAATIAWCLYCAATYPEHQAAVYEELSQAGLAGPSARPLAQDDLTRLPLTTAFINEVMRLHPTAAVSTSRHATHAKRIGGYLVPSGVTVWAPIYGVHTSSHNWEEPLEFKPERWAVPDVKLAKGSTVNVRFMPFGTGTKQCIGQVFATVTVQASVIRILAAYKVALGPDVEATTGLAKLSSTGFITKLNKLQLRLEKRQ